MFRLSLTPTARPFTRLATMCLLLLSFLLAPAAASTQTMGGLAFDGIDDYVVLSSALADQLSEKQQLSVEVRLTFHQLTSGGGIFSYRKRSGQSESKVLELRTSDDDGGQHLVVAISGGPDNAQTATTTTLQVDREYLISLVFDGTQPLATQRTRLYVDGVQQVLTGGENTPAVSPKLSANAPVFVGRAQDSYSAVTLRELRVWETALTPVAVVANAASGLTAPFTSDLAAYYDFNGPNPNARQDPTVLNDQQAGNYSGQLTNFDYTGTTSGWVQAFALPVELVSFTAAAVAGHNRLDWTVASERAFGYYSVERSRDGRSGWEELERVYPSVGDEGAEKQYRAVDATPPASAYYRLQMVDLDGTFEYSDVVLQEREVAAAVALSVYPNPTSGPVTLELTTDEAVSLALTDMSGRRVWQQELAAGAAGRASLNPELAPGVYLLTARSGGSAWNQRLVVR